MYVSNQNVAYDLSRFDNRRKVRDEDRLRELEKPKSVPKKNLLTGRIIAAAVVIAALAFVMIYNYMTLTQITAQNSDLKAQLQEYRDEEVLLRTKQESIYNLSDVELYAQTNLNMVKFDKNQIEYVNMENPDKAEGAYITAESSSPGFAATLKNGIKAVVEYFR